MANPQIIAAQGAFSGGLNVSSDEGQLRPDEVRIAEDGRLTEYGGILRRGGTQRLHATALQSGSPVLGGYSWQRVGVVQQLAVSNGILHTATYNIPTTWTAQSGSMISNARARFAPFWDGASEVCYVADGGLLNKWDGTTFSTDLSGSPSVSLIAVHNNRLFGSGDTANPQRLYASSLNDGDTLGDTSSGGVIADVRTFGQQEITALLSLGDTLLIFHRRGISAFTGYSQDDIAISSGTRGLSADVGTTAPDTCISVENVGYFLSDRGIYSVDTSRGVRSISSKIEALIATLDQTQFYRAFAVHNRPRREVLFYLPDIGVMAYNYRVDAWTGPWLGIYASAGMRSAWTAQDNTSPIVLFGAADGFVRQTDTPNIWTDDVLSDGTGGSAYTLRFQCHRMYGADRYAEKAWRYCYLTVNPRGTGNPTVAWITATVTGVQTAATTVADPPLWDTAVWNAFIWGGTGSTIGRAHLDGRGEFIDIQIRDANSAESVYSRVETFGSYLARRVI